jgi:hypothetical protein
MSDSALANLVLAGHALVGVLVFGGLVVATADDARHRLLVILLWPVPTAARP